MTSDDIAVHLVHAKTPEDAAEILPPWMQKMDVGQQVFEAWQAIGDLAKQRDESIALKPYKTAQYNEEFWTASILIADKLVDAIREVAKIFRAARASTPAWTPPTRV
jgi:hypothetical protein